MANASQASLLQALDALEAAEAQHLAWGLLDESWSEDTLVTFLHERCAGHDPSDLIAGLLAERLLIQVPKQWPKRYRTRMSESVRLFSHLRQLFAGKPWQSGSPLVSDYRFLRRARSFPRWDVPAAEVLASLAASGVSPRVLMQVKRLLKARALSQFQLDSTEAVFSALGSGADRGVVVGAGTGSGKTLAFYLPALSHLASSGVNGPRVIAIYPRNELLKDQLATAVQEVRGLRASGGRTLTVGAYFGPTPLNSRFDPGRNGWRRSGRSWICPFLTCPAEVGGELCGGALVWTRPAPSSEPDNWGSLGCQRCGGLVTSEEFELTRDAMHSRPPDILFTTTEMLNQQLTDGWSRHVFGLGSRAQRPPNLVLLDEIHTYSATSGAQVAFLLRRWRKLLGRPVTWVGLSATLANAGTFFADLCGIPVEAVADVRPEAADMAQQGSEYQLLLRGDPASQSALLSTSIQSLMLLRRVLNETGSDKDNLYGTRVFAFLENLDLVNRLYRQLLDAEGRDALGRPVPGGVVLAGLRIHEYASRHLTIGDEKAWNRDGQHWWLTEELGFGARSLEISRTSSQDPGVESTADIVVATSSLEVGYDDPRVGAVLQHKAPRDIAQFLQRRGRAGRVQSQRPWTVVVLSDYGRDRLAFQDYEAILDPLIPAKSIPLGNQSVRKMQAAMCVLDWLAARLQVDGPRRWSVRNVLSGRSDSSQDVQRCLHLLEKVLEGGPARQDLIEFTRSSLGLTEEEMQSICWEHPRSLLLEVVPTAYRRLRSGWATVRSHQSAPGTDVSARQPLPEYIPSTLFSDLELPEVTIDPPSDYDPAADTTLPIGMALNELTPGKVTLRWAVRKVLGLWIEVPASGVLELSDGLAAEGEVIREVTTPEGVVPVVRPVTIRPTKPPPPVKSTSTGRFRWQFAIDHEAEGTCLPRPRNSLLGDLIPDMRAFLNVDRGPLRTWRFALDSTAEVVTRSGRTRRDVTFTHGGSRAAVGFASTVDAITITVDLPSSIARFSLLDDHERLRQLRTDRFVTSVKQGLEQGGHGTFVARWVADVVLSVAAGSVLRGPGIAGLVGLTAAQWQSLAGEIVDGVLLATRHTDDDEAPLRDTVLDALGDDEVARLLEETLPILGEEPNATWLPFIRTRFLQTVAAAVAAATQQFCPDFNVDADLLVDVVDVDEEETVALIVLTDVVPGGGGLVETLTRRISDDPRRFDALVAAVLEPSDTEEVDLCLRRVLDRLLVDPRISEAAAAFRAATVGRLGAWQTLVSHLSDGGIPRSHANLSAMSARIFRPGSGPDSDDLLRLLLRRWDEIDARAGFALDHRAVCAFLAQDAEVLDRLNRFAAPSDRDEESTRALSVLLGLLWTRASARRSQALRTSNRFVPDPPATERTLVLDILPSLPASVDVDIPDWRARLANALRMWGTARILSDSGNTAALAHAVRQLMVEPIEVDWLQAYPHVEGTFRERGRYSVSLLLREAPQ